MFVLSKNEGFITKLLIFFRISEAIKSSIRAGADSVSAQANL